MQTINSALSDNSFIFARRDLLDNLYKFKLPIVTTYHTCYPRPPIYFSINIVHRYTTIQTRAAKEEADFWHRLLGHWPYEETMVENLFPILLRICPQPLTKN